MLLWRSGGRSRDIRGSMAKVHNVASFNCIPIKVVKFVSPDNVRVFLKNFTFPNFGGRTERFRGVGLREDSNEIRFEI